ncbi:hypothetical protein A8C32_09840 [Flavivirga aquatica]|uniref:Uncharacterized protein n=2 Tax=Flavivirga aquatica TaxID=1849968 RepID=A0A1E5TEK0_9FLAO|nr:hypothetical protein A8C32_09840 [Flavivirga aquatica]
MIFTSCKNKLRKENQKIERGTYLFFHKEKSNKYKLSYNIDIVKLDLKTKDTICTKVIYSKKPMVNIEVLDNDHFQSINKEEGFYNFFCYLILIDGEYFELTLNCLDDISLISIKEEISYIDENNNTDAIFNQFLSKIDKLNISNILKNKCKEYLRVVYSETEFKYSKIENMILNIGLDVSKNIKMNNSRLNDIDSIWYGNYSLFQDLGKIDDIGISIGYSVEIKNDSVIFSGQGYQTNFYDLCTIKQNKDTLELFYNKTIDGMDYNKSVEGVLAKLYKEKDNYYIISKEIDDGSVENDVPVLLYKEE